MTDFFLAHKSDRQKDLSARQYRSKYAVLDSVRSHALTNMSANKSASGNSPVVVCNRNSRQILLLIQK